MLLLLIIVFAGVSQWALWMLRLGRFNRQESDSSIRYVLAEFFAKLINDFRHLLALLMVTLFGMALFAAMWPGMMKQDVSLIKEGVQAVAAALSGLIGSIIGYYFGESAAKSRAPGENTVSPPVVEQLKVEQPPPSTGVRYNGSTQAGPGRRTRREKRMIVPRLEVKDSIHDPDSPDRTPQWRDQASDKPLYKVFLYLDGLGLPYINAVTYVLHPTFKEPTQQVIRTASNPRCKLELWTWGLFRV